MGFNRLKGLLYKVSGMNVGKSNTSLNVEARFWWW